MRRMRATVALMLVALWLPASSHSLLRQFGLIHEFHEHHHPGDHDDPDHGEAGHHEHGVGNHAAADGECVLSVADAPFSAPTAVPPCDFTGLACFPLIGPPSGIELKGPAPPPSGRLELAPSWQFILRAAPRVRAPSIAA